jgi:hypothetical protein
MKVSFSTWKKFINGRSTVKVNLNSKEMAIQKQGLEQLLPEQDRLRLLRALRLDFQDQLQENYLL